MALADVRRSRLSASGRASSYRPTPAKVLAEKGNGKGNKYRGKRFKINFTFEPSGILGFFGKLLLLGLMFLFLAAVSVGLLMSYRWMTSLPYFSLQEVVVQGNQRLTYDEIVSTSGVRFGDNSLAISMSGVESALIQNPWIESVAVKRVLPGSLRIHVVERQACFWVRKDDKLYYADDTGGLIAPVEGDRFISLPVLEVAGNEVGPRMDVLPEVIKLLDSKSLPFGLKQTSWMRLSGKNGIEVYLEDSDVTLGASFEDWRGNLQRLNKVWLDLKRRGELSQVKTIRAAGSKVMVERRG